MTYGGVEVQLHCSEPRHGIEVSSHLHAPARYLWGNSPWYVLYRWLGGPQSRSGPYREEKSLLPLQKI
jgi:hypothetical protein